MNSTFSLILSMVGLVIMKAKNWIFVGIICFLPGCHSVRQSFGLERSELEAFDVMDHKPLSMPPTYYARPKPHLGKERPQEKPVVEEAHKKLFGDGEKPKEGLESLSTGQRSLLKRAQKQK